ncbi:unnamed protein product [Orchesella dallaii]|uniref:Uncharacterized protein n=1 Tax=Orchesella dallaii TaxID=48710 RepID=A0ABP1QXE9_9HEXA
MEDVLINNIVGSMGSRNHMSVECWCDKTEAFTSASAASSHALTLADLPFVNNTTVFGHCKHYYKD